MSDTHAMLRLEQGKRLVLLPVQEKEEIAHIAVLDQRNEMVKRLNVKLAVDKVDYLVPLEIGQGQLLCIGNGGCEFSMKNADGTPDKSAHPKNNIYQDNVLRLAKNSLEYLKTR